MAVFLTAAEARSSARSNLVIFDEVRTIERAVLVASDAGDYECTVNGTVMTETTVDSWKDFHSPITITGTVGVADAGTSPFVTSGHSVVLNTITVTFTGTSLTSVVNDVNAAFPAQGIVASSILVSGSYYLRLYSSSGDPVVIAAGSGTGLADVGLTAGTTRSLNPTSDTITFVSHGFVTGDKIQFKTAGTLPSGLTSGYSPVYYAISVDADNFKVSTSYSNALNSIPIDLVNQGTGVHSVRKVNDSELYYQTFQKTVTDRVKTDQMSQVISYFQSLNYSIARTTNSDTGTTFSWSLAW